MGQEEAGGDAVAGSPGGSGAVPPLLLPWHNPPPQPLGPSGGADGATAEGAGGDEGGRGAASAEHLSADGGGELHGSDSDFEFVAGEEAPDGSGGQTPGSESDVEMVVAGPVEISSDGETISSDAEDSDSGDDVVITNELPAGGRGGGRGGDGGRGPSGGGGRGRGRGTSAPGGRGRGRGASSRGGRGRGRGASSRDGRGRGRGANSRGGRGKGRVSSGGGGRGKGRVASSRGGRGSGRGPNGHSATFGNGVAALWSEKSQEARRVPMQKPVLEGLGLVDLDAELGCDLSLVLSTNPVGAPTSAPGPVSDEEKRHQVRLFYSNPRWELDRVDFGEVVEGVLAELHEKAGIILGTRRLWVHLWRLPGAGDTFGIRILTESPWPAGGGDSTAAAGAAAATPAAAEPATAAAGGGQGAAGSGSSGGSDQACQAAAARRAAGRGSQADPSGAAAAAGQGGGRGVGPDAAGQAAAAGPSAGGGSEVGREAIVEWESTHQAQGLMELDDEHFTALFGLTGGPGDPRPVTVVPFVDNDAIILYVELVLEGSAESHWAMLTCTKEPNMAWALRFTGGRDGRKGRVLDAMASRLIPARRLGEGTLYVRLRRLPDTAASGPRARQQQRHLGLNRVMVCSFDILDNPGPAGGIGGAGAAGGGGAGSPGGAGGAGPSAAPPPARGSGSRGPGRGTGGHGCNGAGGGAGRQPATDPAAGPDSRAGSSRQVAAASPPRRGSRRGTENADEAEADVAAPRPAAAPAPPPKRARPNTDEAGVGAAAAGSGGREGARAEAGAERQSGVRAGAAGGSGEGGGAGGSTARGAGAEVEVEAEAEAGEPQQGGLDGQVRAGEPQSADRWALVPAAAPQGGGDLAAAQAPAAEVAGALQPLPRIPASWPPVRLLTTDHTSLRVDPSPPALAARRDDVRVCGVVFPAGLKQAVLESIDVWKEGHAAPGSPEAWRDLSGLEQVDASSAPAELRPLIAYTLAGLLGITSERSGEELPSGPVPAEGQGAMRLEGGMQVVASRRVRRGEALGVVAGYVLPAVDAAEYAARGSRWCTEEVLRELGRLGGAATGEAAWGLLARAAQLPYPGLKLPREGAAGPEPLVLSTLGYGSLAGAVRDMRAAAEGGAGVPEANCQVIPVSVRGLVLPVLVACSDIKEGVELMTDCGQQRWERLQPKRGVVEALGDGAWARQVLGVLEPAQGEEGQ
ncbi:hypothetical protein HYH03_018544 [Edaphochlamys debaryana]|uniref:Uncharacterized protein n=1 Tax=Edaphochlamys debaryana TaxID=47281 RepID=A0A835XGB7_9CHLO|nr:hypothetical protein HYH03_018544 [Edaphochlamys debaryana]|eukprot:KAG2482527.1 hypothetical protein HYH03_018544 [Edaphochlamys debaryana]